MPSDTHHSAHQAEPAAASTVSKPQSVHPKPSFTGEPPTTARESSRTRASKSKNCTVKNEIDELKTMMRERRTLACHSTPKHVNNLKSDVRNFAKNFRSNRLRQMTKHYGFDRVTQRYLFLALSEVNKELLLICSELEEMTDKYSHMRDAQLLPESEKVRRMHQTKRKLQREIEKEQAAKINEAKTEERRLRLRLHDQKWQLVQVKTERAALFKLLDRATGRSH